MRRSSTISVLACYVWLWACVTPRDQIVAGRATLIRETVRSSLYEITGLVLINQERIRLGVAARDCVLKIGSLYSPGDSSSRGSVSIKELMIDGEEPADRLFAQMCDIGLPVTRKLWQAENERLARLTPEQRAEEEAAERRRDEAVRRMIEWALFPRR